LRLSKLFGRTLRETPSGAESVSHKLLLRAGMIRQLSVQGLTLGYSYLPLALRVLRKIEGIVREEMDAIGSQEIRMLLVHPAELLKETKIGPGMACWKDRGGHEMFLGMAYEEVVTDLARREIGSYRQLPFMVYQIGTRFREEPRSHGGLIRMREFTAMDAYSFHPDQASLDEHYLQVHQAYLSIFRRCSLDTIVVQGGAEAHDFISVTEAGDDQLSRHMDRGRYADGWRDNGSDDQLSRHMDRSHYADKRRDDWSEDSIILCTKCDYAASGRVARMAKGTVGTDEELPLEEAATPGCVTIEAVANCLGVPKARTAKAVFYAAGGEVVFVVIRGDLEVNETKLANALKAADLRPATEEEIRALRAVPGYASPVGLEGVKVVVDDSIPAARNLVAGANKESYHLVNVNYGRDFTADVVADIAAAQPGGACIHCGGKLRAVQGVAVGKADKLGTKYSRALGATFLGCDGQERPLVMGHYSIAISRMMAAVIEQHHDDKGIIWPPSIAPYQIHLVALSMNDPRVVEAAEGLYAELQARGFEVLYDDRDEGAGVKFNDADLIGIPLRLTVSPRTLKQNGAELKLRWEKEARVVGLEGLYSAIEAALIGPSAVAQG